MGEVVNARYDPPQPVAVSAVMFSHGSLHLWQVGGGLWHWHDGCANVAAVGFFQTVCEQLTDPPEGGYRLDTRGSGLARELIAEAWRGVHSSRPYPRTPSYVLGAAVWALARNGISFGFVNIVGKVKLMAKAKKGDAGPEALPSAATSGSVSFLFHDVLLLDCEYQVMGPNIRVRINKSHVTGSLQALLTAISGVASPILRGDVPISGTIADNDSGPLLQLDLEGVIDDLAPKPMGAPVMSHDGTQAKLPAVAGKLEQVSPTADQSQAAAAVDAIAAMMNQSADGGEGTEVDDELPFDPLGSLDPLEDLGSESPGEQMIEVPDNNDDEALQPLELLAEESSVEVFEVVNDADSVELATNSGETVAGQTDLRGNGALGVAGDDVIIQVEEIDLEEASSLEDLSNDSGAEDDAAGVEGDSEDDGSDAAAPLVGDEELDDIPEPVGSPRADKKTKAAVAQAQVGSTKASVTQQSAAAAAKATENTVPEGKIESPQKDPIPGLRIPTAKELKEYADLLSEESKASVIRTRDAMQLKYTTLEKLDAPAGKLIGALWATHRDKFAGKPIDLAHRFLLGAYIAKMIQAAKAAAGS